MSLSTGQRLGSYEILGLLGAGGMGEVYRARDTKLQRDVAIKIVPASLANDPVARARFDAESRAVATLSHPNIIAIFDAGSDGDIVYAVTELLEGKTLRDVLKDGPVPVRRAVDIAVQVAAGLAAAHAQGITHRDLKPENIFVTRDGRVKVLDFGLAKMVVPSAGEGSVAATYTPTSPGTVLGTVGYMSPEQVRALPVDHRSDIFSLGAVLYELLTGVRAFTGTSAVETMNAILKEDPPDLARSNAALPPALDRIVRRCLEKEPDQRFESARDLGFALDAISTSSAAAAAPVTVAATLRTKHALTAALVLAAAAVGALAGRLSVPAPSMEPVTFESKTFDPMTVFNGRFAADGTTVIFSAAMAGRNPDLYVFRPDGVAPQRFGPAKTHLLSVSSTGELAVLTNAEYIGHRLFRGTLARMRLDGTPRPWLENVREADWSPDASTLAIVREVGLKDQLEYPIGKTLHTGDGYLSDVRISPDGEHVAFFEHPIRFDDRGWLKVVDKAGTVKTLTPEYWGAEGIAWTSDGKGIVYAAGDKGWDSFYPRVVTIDGKPRSSFGVSGIGMFLFDVSPKGTWLITRNDDERGARALLPGDTEERELAWLGSVGGGTGGGLSPSGRLFLFTDESESAGPTYAVSVRNTDGSPPVRLGPGAGRAFSPDETRVLADKVTPPGSAIYPVGAGEPVQLPNGPLTAVSARHWFSDGRRIVVCGREASKLFRCYQQDVASGAIKPLTPENYDVGPLSHGDRTIVLLAVDGTSQLFDLATMSVRPLPGAETGDNFIDWSADDRSLFVQKRGDVVGRLERLDVASGRRTLVRELKPPDRTTLMRVNISSVFKDGAGYSYNYWKRPSRLLVARGVPQ
jgi:eukaryotic-like serine/threonine-protein kinase